MKNKNSSGWRIINGTDQNCYETAQVLLALTATTSSLPKPPPGYEVLVAPVSQDTPAGLRCAFARVLSQKTEDTDQWAFENFGLYAELLYCFNQPSQNGNHATYVLMKMREYIGWVS